MSTWTASTTHPMVSLISLNLYGTVFCHTDIRWQSVKCVCVCVWTQSCCKPLTKDHSCFKPKATFSVRPSPHINVLAHFYYLYIALYWSFMGNWGGLAGMRLQQQQSPVNCDGDIRATVAARAMLPSPTRGQLWWWYQGYSSCQSNVAQPYQRSTVMVISGLQ